MIAFHIARHKQFITVICLLFFCAFSATAQKGLYPAPQGLAPSAEYKVWINNQPAFVYASPIPAAYCSFDMGAPVTIKIKVSRDVKWVDVRPLSANIKPIFKDSTIELQLYKPQKLSIEINGSLKHPLFLFANEPEGAKPSKATPGLRYFEAGKIYYAGLLTLQSNEAVYIEGGAVVVGAIAAKGASNIKVFGRGVLDGTYNGALPEEGFGPDGIDSAKVNRSKKHYRRAMDFTDCNNVVVEGITLHNNTSWQIAPVHCNKVRIQNVKVVSDQPSDDGTDIVRCRNVVIRDCFYRTKDDCIAIKAYKGYAKEEAVDGVLVENCVFWNALWGNGLEIGFELDAAEVKNIIFRNCDIIHIEAGAAISIHNAGTAHVHDVLFENIRIEDVRQKLFDFAIFRSQYSEDGIRDEAERRRLYLNGAWDGVLLVPSEEKAAHAKYRGRISGVVLRRVQIVDGLFPFSVFYGFDASHNVSNVRIENLKVHGKNITSVKEAKLYVENTASITVK